MLHTTRLTREVPTWHKMMMMRLGRNSCRRIRFSTYAAERWTLITNLARTWANALWSFSWQIR
ncbi:hypothetical protein DAI22_12g115200 [Oryza sativa Japonica Group]|nr:hypothetical protein DAI22_12g115200 [Oryza sativa Japonica Group]